MGFTTLENTPLEVDLVAQSVTTGWSFSGTTAVHEACNAGYLELIPPQGLTITAGETYQITYNIESISGGFIVPMAGGTSGTQRSTPQFVIENITASGSSPKFRFYSNAACVITIFDITDTATVTTAKQQNNIVYSEKTNKWSSFYTYVPDCGFGLFINLYTFKGGNLYLHQHGSVSRNNFYGTQYDTMVDLPFNQHITQSNTFESISIQSNQLMITTTDGITTSLSQISELIASDFTKATLTEGATTVVVNTKEGMYSAPFLRDKNIDLINGDVLKGNWITIELITTDSTALRLFSVALHSERSFIGFR